MAFDAKPSTWLGAGYDSDSGTHTITMNTDDAASDKTLTELTDAKADPATGDIRNVAFALCQALFAAWLSQGVDTPTKMTISRSASASSGGNVQYEYRFKFVLSPGSYSVPSE